jgi:hypothetical protein
VSLCAALAYSVLVRTIIRANGPDSVVARSIHGDTKGLVSIGLFAAGVAIATLSAWVPMGRAAEALPLACYVAVAIIWLIPDRRFLHDHATTDDD